MKRLSLLFAVSLLSICQVTRSQTLPSGFSASTVGSGWNLPLGSAFTPDGQKLFVWEKDGRVYVCNRNAAGAYIKQTTPVLDISEEVANWGDHGLMGFALDPNYLSNGLIYLLYVVDRHYLMNFGTPSYNPATSSTGATIGRITRYKTVTSGSNIIADLSTRFILLGETRQTGICIMHDSHGLGTLAFAADGTLLATAGDGASYYLVDKGSDTDTDFDLALADGIIRPAENVGAFRAQILNSHNGKLLRIDPVTGNGVSSNPFYSAAQPRSPKSRVWAFGLRNPYRFSIKPGTGSNNPAAGDVGEIFVGDVGWNTYEEVSIITRGGVNCGWPLFEGLTPQPGYTSAVTANLDEPNPLYGIGGCTKQYFNFQDLVKQVTADNNKTVFNSCSPATPIGTGDRYVHYRPAIEWKHFTNEARVGTFSGNTASVAIIGTPESNVIGTPFPGNCATGGPWYNGTNFPAAYQDIYFAADHDGGWIRGFKVDFTDVVTEVKNFGSGFSGIVNVVMNPLDGTLFVVELGNFSSIPTTIKQIKYGGNQSPIVKMTSDKKYGPSALAVNFTGNGSSDPDGTVASYLWNFGDGGTSTSANPSHSFTAPANTPTKYVTKLTVTDNLGAASIDSIIISVNNTPPVVNITSPVKNSLYKIGPDTLYTCSATVSDAEHNAASLKYEWQTFLRHNSHAHPEPISTAVSPTTSISRIGCNGDTYYWLIQLTVTDPAGLSSVDSSKIFPDCSAGTDITPPTISSVSPVNGATSVSTGTTVTAVFNETVDPVTVTGTTFQLKDAGNNIVPVTINTSFNQITLTPLTILAGSTVYTATIKSGASGVKDLAGNALVNDYVWTFTTVAADNTPPTITTVSPVNGAGSISTGTTIVANFSEAINASTINGTTVQLKDAGNNVIAAALNISGNQVTLTPSALLAGSTIHTVTIKSGASGVKDLAGNALINDYTWSFTTAAVDNVAPTVSSVSPLSGAIDVDVSTTVMANFNEAVNASTVTGTTFQLKSGTNVVAASASVSGNQIILTPSSALTGSTVYTATITGGASGVKDLAGNSLASDYSWTFTTVAITTLAPVTIQSSDTKTGTAATVHSLTGVPAGTLLVLATTADAVVSDCIVSSSPSLTWTKRVDAGATSSDNAEIWTAVYAAGGSIAVTSNWGGENSQASVCYIVLNAEPTLGGAFGTAVLQAAPSVTINTTRDNSIIFGCTADWKAINGATRTLRDAATERLYFKDGNYTTYHYTKTAASIGAYTEGVSLPTGQQASTALLEIRGPDIIPPAVTTQPASQTRCAGVNASFTSAASGNPAPTVQWQESTNGTTWINITGATSSTLSFTATFADNNKQYRAVWTNSASAVNSNPAVLTVNAIPASPAIDVVNNCGNSVLTASGFTGSLLWNNGAASASITVTTGGTYTVMQTVNGCTSDIGSGIAAPLSSPAAPAVSVVNNCGNSVLTASGFTGSLSWSNGQTTASITVITGGTYTVTQTVNGCMSAAGSAVAEPKIIPAAPSVGVVNNCGNSVLTASGFTGSLLWSTAETTNSITVTADGTYTVTQTVDGCTSETGSGLAAPLNPVVATPTIAVVDDCGSSTLTAEGFTGTLLWSTGETTPSIVVANPGTYTVTQAVNGCNSAPGNGIATPKTIPIAPAIGVVNNCESSVLTASGFTGSLLWSTAETTPSITVNNGGTYTVTQTVNGCASPEGSGIASPKTIPSAPTVEVANNCGNSVLTASGFTGSLLWGNGANTSSITVTTGGTYTVTQSVNGCVSPEGSGIASPVNIFVASPTITVIDNCGGSVLTAEEFTGTLLWNTGSANSSITVTEAGTYTVTQTVNGCTSAPGSGIATPKTIPAAPAVGVINNCESSVLTASEFSGSLLWSTAETTPSIMVNNGGVYTLTQTVDGCTSTPGSGTASPLTTPTAPSVTVVNQCGNSVLTASGFTGSLLWSNGATTASITVNNAGTYTVTQMVSGCTSAEGSGTAAPFNSVVDSPVVTVVDNCVNSILKAESFTGSLLWSNGATTNSITVTTPGTYTVTQTVNGCISPAASGTAAPMNSTITAPIVTVVNNCDNSVLTAGSFTGSLLWSNGATTPDITVITGGTYTVTQTVNGCSGAAGSGLAAPKTIPSAPDVAVVNNCGSSVLTASGFTGSLLWSNGETTASIIVNTAGTYTVTQTINGCTSEAGSGIAAPKAIPVAPTVSVVDNCGSSTLTASSFTGSLVWSNAATTTVITVTTAATYSVTQTLNGCTSAAGSGVAAPKAFAALSGNLFATATSGIAFTYTANSATAGTSFAWSRAAVTGISNAAASGTGNIDETLVNTLSTAINVTYVYTLTANGCVNTQNVVVTVSSVPVVTTVSPENGATGINTSSLITANFSEAINASTVTATTFQLKDAGNNIIPATISTSSNLITLTPSSALANSTVYTVTIKGGASGVKGLTENALASDYSWSFTTVAVISQPPVTIQSSNTKTGTAATVHSLTGVPPDALLILTTTSDAVVSNCNVSSSPSLTWTKRVDAGATSSDNAEIWTAVYTAGGSITVTSNWGAVSQTSVCYVVLNAEPTLNGAFGTATLQSSPSVNVTSTRDNSIIFGCTADWKAINGATRTLRDAAAEILYFKDGNYTTYHYTKTATAIAAYTEGVSLPTGQQASTALLEIRSVSSAPDITPPAVSSVTPLNGATGLPVNITASAIFNEAMNAATINSSTIELRNASNVLIATSVAYNAGTRTATITPSAALANSTVYTVTIKGNAPGVKDVAGNALASDYSWSFTTDVGDITPPSVSSVSPVNGATGVIISTTASAIFNETMNSTTLNSSTIELRNASNVLITTAVSYNATTRTVTITPSAALATSTVYTVTIKGGASGVKDAAGNALAGDYSWSFTTSAVTSQPVTIQSVNTKTGTAATVHSLTGVPPDALLILTTTSDAVVSNCNVSSSPSLTWTKRVDAGATSSDNAEIWTAVYTAGGSITVTSNWGAVSQTSVCYVVLNAEPTLNGAFGTATLQSSPSVTVTSTRDNSIIFGCTADWKAINGATRTLRDAAAERLYFKDGNYTTYHYTKTATAIAAYTEGVSLPTGQQASTALLEIRGASTLSTRPVNPVIIPALSGDDLLKEKLEINVMPNPSNAFFNLVIKANAGNPVQVRVTDIFGRVIERHEKIAGNTTLRMGHSWASGLYFVEVIQADQRRFAKIIKVN